MELGKKERGKVGRALFSSYKRLLAFNSHPCWLSRPAGAAHKQHDAVLLRLEPSSPAQAAIPWLGREIPSPAVPPAPPAPRGGAAGLILDELGFIRWRISALTQFCTPSARFAVTEGQASSTQGHNTPLKYVPCAAGSCSEPTSSTLLLPKRPSRDHQPRFEGREPTSCCLHPAGEHPLLLGAHPHSGVKLWDTFGETFCTENVSARRIFLLSPVLQPEHGGMRLAGP